MNTNKHCHSRCYAGVIGIFLLLSGLLSGCGKNTEVTTQIPLEESPADNPSLIKVTYGDVEDAKYIGGEINPKTLILQFPQEGSFLKYRVSLGDFVKKGEEIASCEEKYTDEIKELKEQISDLEKEYQDTVSNFKAQITTNDWKVGQRREWIENMEPDMEGFDQICIDFELLISQGERIKLLQRQYVAQTEAELTYMRQCLEELEQKNNNNKIIAPADGTITYLANLHIGDSVSVRSYPVALAQTENKYVQCEYIAAQEIEKLDRVYIIKDGKEYDVTFVPYDERELQEKNMKGEGTYSFFEMSDINDEVTFGDKVILVAVKEQRKKTLVVPTICINRDANRTFVYRQENGKKISVDVEIGVSDKINTEIVSGIQEGDMIYVSN